ncbi:MAG: hypothetical protein P8J32_04465, partial [bacterium]|nr:hypothetical protein [bacterium]
PGTDNRTQHMGAEKRIFIWDKRSFGMRLKSNNIIGNIPSGFRYHPERDEYIMRQGEDEYCLEPAGYDGVFVCYDIYLNWASNQGRDIRDEFLIISKSISTMVPRSFNGELDYPRLNWNRPHYLV